MKFDELELIKLEDFEKEDQALAAAKANRSPVEYYFTCTPSLPLFVFRRCEEVDLITYLDADLYFFSTPEPIFEEISGASVALIPHRFSYGLERLAKTGIYNVGWLSFRRDQQGLSCLSWWRERCNEWCYDRIEPDRFADQKYLDQWPRLFKSVAVIQHKGANVAPWNMANYQLQKEAGGILVDDQPLIFFHFHGLKTLFPKIYDSGLSRYKTALSGVVRTGIYHPYIREVASISSDGQLGTIRQQIIGLSPLDVLRRIRFAIRVAVSLLRGNLIVLMGQG